MSPVHHYKQLENIIVHRLTKGLKHFFYAVLNYFRKLHLTGKQRFTVMFIPHSEKKIFNFQISIYSLSFCLLLIIMIVIVIFFLSTYFTYDQVQDAKRLEQLERNGKLLDDYHELMIPINKKLTVLQETMGNLLALLDPEMATRFLDTSRGGNTPSLQDKSGLETTSRELADLQNILIFLENIELPLKTIMNRTKEQNRLFLDIPTLWPLKERGVITFGFGPRIHPIMGYWYIHRGIDLVLARGASVVATAAGKVIKVQYDLSGYGAYIILSHKYGFSTLYAHLDAIYVSKGEEIERGQVIGTLGATGLVTGPHLHYEIRIGNQAVDPMLFIDTEE